MAIPPEWNGDLFAWLNFVLGQAGELNYKLKFIREEWAALTVVQKTAIKTKVANALIARADDLDAIAAEILAITNA